MTLKEFEMQKALGLADAYDLTISLYPNFTGRTFSHPELEATVKEHTFESKLIEKTYSDDPTAAIPFMTFKFKVKCVHKIMDIINKALPNHPMTMAITFQSSRRFINQSNPYRYYEGS